MRKRTNQKKYAKHTRNVPKDVCEFCELTTDHSQVIEERDSFWVIKNIFPYDLWDSAGVLDHLMILPKRHIDTIGHFSAKELTEYPVVIGDYDKKGYSIYARARGSAIKSIIHQHTHLIAIDNKMKKTIFFWNKPHILIKK